MLLYVHVNRIYEVDHLKIFICNDNIMNRSVNTERNTRYAKVAHTQSLHFSQLLGVRKAVKST